MSAFGGQKFLVLATTYSHFDSLLKISFWSYIFTYQQSLFVSHLDFVATRHMWSFLVSHEPHGSRQGIELLASVYSRLCHLHLQHRVTYTARAAWYIDASILHNRLLWCHWWLWTLHCLALDRIFRAGQIHCQLCPIKLLFSQSQAYAHHSWSWTRIDSPSFRESSPWTSLECRVDCSRKKA